MDLFFYFVIFLFGLSAGSFLNCVIYRLAASERRASPNEGGREARQSFLKGRSFCPHCKHQLSRLDLIPVLSFLFLRGHCRYCKKKISLQYPLVELATGILFFSIFLLRQNTPMGEFGRIYYLVVISFLIVIFVYDLRHYIIPDKVVFPAIGFAFLGGWNLFGIWNLAFGILPAIFLLAIILLSRGRWMGMGDFKLAILIGLILGWPNIAVALFFAFLLGAILGVGLIAAKKKGLKSEVPFGPFLVTGTLIALFWGQNIINWYMDLIYV